MILNILNNTKISKTDKIIPSLNEINKLSKKNLRSWSKAFLSIYSLIPNIVSSIDSLVLSKAKNSIYLQQGQTVYDLADKILLLEQQKINFINLKIMIEESLVDIKSEYRNLLIVRYVDSLPSSQCPMLFDMDRRTFFRKLASALDSFQKILSYKILMSPLTVRESLKDEFIDNILNNILKTQIKNDGEEMVTNNKDFLCGLIVNKFRKLF